MTAIPTQRDEQPVLVPEAIAAYAAQVSAVTVRQWRRRYGLTYACDLVTGRLLYDLTEIMQTERATRQSAEKRRSFPRASDLCNVKSQ